MLRDRTRGSLKITREKTEEKRQGTAMDHAEGGCGNDTRYRCIRIVCLHWPVLRTNDQEGQGPVGWSKNWQYVHARILMAVSSHRLFHFSSVPCRILYIVGDDVMGIRDGTCSEVASTWHVHECLRRSSASAQGKRLM